MLAGSSVFASGEAIAGIDNATTQIKIASAVSGIVINGTGNDTVPVKLLVSNGTLAMSTTTGLSFTGSPTGSTLYFSGSRSDINTALATLTYTRNTLGSDTLEISLVSPGEVFLPENGHLYEYVASTLTWTNAKTAAEGRSKYGATGYLTTVTSQTENDFVSARLSNAGWMGASDSGAEGAWRWVTGPENGTQFWQGTGTGATVGGNYANWNNGEPNDSGANEDCGQFLTGGTGKWNDLPCSGTTLPGYVVEYGTLGNMPTVAAKNVSLTTVDTTAPTVPGAPSATTPTTDQTPTWTWSASTDAGAGLANPAYSVQWSQSSTFASGVSSATTNSTSYTNLSNLADGTWYFRVRASDIASNTSVYSSNGTVVIDTTAPSAPDLSASTTKTHSATPSITWNASSDSGVGLANPAYTVQRSQSATFTSGITAATTNSTTFTTPSLADGTWYVRVRASDQLGNVSAWSPTVTIIIDTVLPTTPGTPSTPTPTNNKKLTWTWSSSTDSGTGLANPAYSVQWSQSSTFSSGVASGTTNTASFTQPANLADGTWYFRVVAGDDAGNASAFSTISSVVVDTSVANISNLLATANSDTVQAVTWTTDKVSSSKVTYGPNTSYSSTTTETDTSPRTTSHSVALSALVPCTLYHYQVISIDTLGNQATSADTTFITPGCAGAAVVTSHAEDAVPTSSGGTVSLPVSSGTVVVGVPAGFSAYDADFQVKQIDTTAALATIGTPGSLQPIGQAYDLKAMRDTTTPITSFTHEVSVTLPYNTNDIASIEEASLAIYRWDGNTGWQKLNACSVNTAAHTVTCTTPGFSTFVLFGSVSPTTATTTGSNAPVVSPRVSHQVTSTPVTLPAEETTDSSEASQPQNTMSTSDTDPDPAPSEKHAAKPARSSKIVWWIGCAILICLFFVIFIVRRRKRKDDPTNIQ
jgi:nitrogen fixation protein FixH